MTQKLMKDSLKISDPPCNATILLLKSRAMNIFVLQEYLKGKLAQKEIDDTGKAIWDSLRPTVDLVDADTKLSLFGSLADLTIAGVAYSYGNARSATAVLRSGLVIEQFYWQAFPQYYGTESDYIRTEVVISGFVTLLEKEEISGVDIISEQIDQYTEIVRKLMSR
ncbi:MAG: hypothetical protein KKH67_08455 [candidate division Zixibacteria bacterium]|nr:hypothetical protein [candidate division Zixibacteria bacterium]MBU1470660.1 hypothetical protein [candidate division Zixibacteria bacterium]